MNIKKMSRVLSLWAVASVSGMTAKANVTNVMDQVFGQERLTTLSTNGVAVSFAKGYYQVTNVWNTSINPPSLISSTTNTYPVLVEDGEKGFAVAHTNIPEFVDVAIDQTSGRVFGAGKGEGTSIYELSLSNVSSNKMMDGRIEIKQKQWMDKYDKPIAMEPERILPFGGEWLIAYSEKQKRNSCLFHINQDKEMNESLVQRNNFSIPYPTYTCEDESSFYVSDGKKISKISKTGTEDPAAVSNIDEGVEIVGIASVGGRLYQATANGVFWQSATAVMNAPIVDKNIHHMMSDGSRLVLACDSDQALSKSQTAIGNVPAILVSGVQKIVTAKNKIFAMTKNNQMIEVRE